MKILGLWVSKYFSGSTDERFIKPLQALGHEVEVVELENPGTEARLLKAAAAFSPDYLLHVPYPGTIRPEILYNLSFNSQIVTIAWNGDDEWAWDMPVSSFHPKEIARVHNWVVTTCEDGFHKYKKAGFDRVILKSWGFSAKDWRKLKTKKDVDVYFCGQRTPERDYFLRELKDQGIKVMIHGAGYSPAVPLDSMIQCYRRAKIGLNFVSGSKEKLKYQQVKARNFEIPAVGTFQLSEWCPALDNFFRKDIEIGTFSHLPSFVKKINHFLKNEKDREAIAERGYEKVQRFSYETIFKDVLERTRRREVK